LLASEYPAPPTPCSARMLDTLKYIVYSSCARLYGQGAKRRTEASVRELEAREAKEQSDATG
jgi:hypothetical protein